MGAFTPPPLSAIQPEERFIPPPVTSLQPERPAKKPKASVVDMAIEGAKGLFVDPIVGMGKAAMALVTPSEAPDGSVRQSIETRVPGGRLLTGAYDAHKRTAGRAVESIKQGKHLKGAAEGVMAAIPLVGPALDQIGEDATGNIKNEDYAGLARNVGQGLSTVAPYPGLGKVSRAVMNKVGPAIADKLQASAVKEYSQVLNPTTRGNKLRTADAVPQLIEKGVMAGSLKGLRGKAQANLKLAGQAIDDAWEGLPDGSSIDANKLINTLTQKADDLHTVNAGGRRMPIGAEAVKALNNVAEIKNTLLAASELDAAGNRILPAATARRIRQYFDKVSEDAGRFEGASLSDKSTAAAHAAGADAIRGQLASEFPDIAAINKEYTLWKNVERVVADTQGRRIGQATPLGVKIAKGAGAAAGMVNGGLGGAIIGREAMGMFESAVSSPAWRTVSAVTKDRLAKSIMRGVPGDFNAAMADVTKALNAADKSKEDN
jgi:hypothetical protein